MTQTYYNLLTKNHRPKILNPWLHHDFHFPDIFPVVSNMKQPDFMSDLGGLGGSKAFFLSRKANDRNMIPFLT